MKRRPIMRTRAIKIVLRYPTFSESHPLSIRPKIDPTEEALERPACQEAAIRYVLRGKEC
jgi:hypothetical protein